MFTLTQYYPCLLRNVRLYVTNCIKAKQHTYSNLSGNYFPLAQRALSSAHHPLQHYVILPAYLFDVRVEGDRHVQQDFALLHAADKVLDSVFELVGGLVDLLWVALSRLGQLLGRLQQLVCIGVRILRRGPGMETERGMD